MGTLILLALVVVGWWYAERQGSDGSLLQFSGSTMGTTYTVKAVQVPESIDSAALQTQVEDILAEVNGQMSTYDANSELSRFNQSETTDWVTVSPELAQVVQQALRISRLSRGAFDVTVGPLVNLWGFGPEMSADELPAKAALEAALARVGYQRLHARLTPPALKKDGADIYVDLSAIAKGYGVDRLAEYLEAQGIDHYLVEIGGELRGKGLNPAGVPWRVAIEKPDPGQRAVQRVIEISDQAIATSGDYRNFFEKDGQRYSHAIDPETGQPVRHELASVTVVNPSALEADAWATALLVLGPQQGAQLAEEQNLAAFLLVLNDMDINEKSTSRFTHYLVDRR